MTLASVPGRQEAPRSSAAVRNRRLQYLRTHPEYFTIRLPSWALPPHSPSVRDLSDSTRHDIVSRTTLDRQEKTLGRRGDGTDQAGLVDGHDHVHVYGHDGGADSVNGGPEECIGGPISANLLAAYDLEQTLAARKEAAASHQSATVITEEEEEETDEDEEDEEDAEDAEDEASILRHDLIELFLAGKDTSFTAYEAVDADTTLDDLQTLARDAEDRYFALSSSTSSSPSSHSSALGDLPDCDFETKSPPTPSARNASISSPERATFKRGSQRGFASRPVAQTGVQDF